MTIVLTSPIHLLRKKLKGIEKLMEYNHEINVFDMLGYFFLTILNAYNIPRWPGVNISIRKEMTYDV